MAKLKQDDPEQSKRFKELAEDIGALGDDRSLAEAVKRVARSPRQEDPKKKAAKKA